MHRPRWGVALVPLALIASMTIGSPARAAAGSFGSSFETDDPQPTWTDTVETDAAGAPRSSGVDGNIAVGMPGSLRDRVIAIAANAQPNSSEGVRNLNDGDSDTKWLVDTPTSWAQYTLDEPAEVVRYTLTSANDAPERDPSDWTLQGSADGAAWTTVDTRADQEFGERFETKTYEVANPASFKIYRLTITGHPSGNLTQLADWELSDGDSTPPPVSVMQSRLGAGPASSPTAKAGVGYTGLKAFQIGGRHLAEGRAYSYNKVFDVDLEVTGDTTLSYLVFPEFNREDLSNPATYAAVDLAFTDGTYLSGLKAVDQHGDHAQPGRAGRVQDALHVAVEPQGVADRPGRRGQDHRPDPGRLRQAVRADVVPGLVRRHHASPNVAPAEPKAHLSDYADTRRGTQSSGSFSRGNNFPATAVPHGFNFWTPVTDSRLDQLAVRVPPRQQRGQPADHRGVLGQPRAQPVDG